MTNVNVWIDDNKFMKHRMFQIYLENFTTSSFYVGLVWVSIYLSEFSRVLEVQTLEEKRLIPFCSLNPPPALFPPVTSILWRLDMKLLIRDVLMNFVVFPPGCGDSVAEFWVWGSHEARLRWPNDVSGDMYRVIHKSLRDFRTRLRNNQDRHGRKEHINR